MSQWKIVLNKVTSFLMPVLLEKTKLKELNYFYFLSFVRTCSYKLSRSVGTFLFMQRRINPFLYLFAEKRKNLSNLYSFSKYLPYSAVSYCMFVFGITFFPYSFIFYISVLNFYPIFAFFECFCHFRDCYFGNILIFGRRFFSPFVTASHTSYCRACFSPLYNTKLL